MDERRVKTYRLQDLVGELEAEQQRRLDAAKSGMAAGPTTSFKELDEAIGGCLSPGLHILQAAPGVGKTAMGLQMAALCKYPAVYVNAEMAVLELFRRIVARHTRTALDLLNQRHTPLQIRCAAMETAAALPLISIVDGASNPAFKHEIEEAAYELKSEFNSAPLIVIDSLQFWARSGAVQTSYQSEYDIMGRGIRILSELASDLKSPVVCICQRNRAGQERGGLFASKGTGDIEYCAETVIELTSDGNGPNSLGESEVTAAVLKNRHGTVGVEVILRFNGALQAFREM